MTDSDDLLWQPRSCACQRNVIFFGASRVEHTSGADQNYHTFTVRTKSALGLALRGLQLQIFGEGDLRVMAREYSPVETTIDLFGYRFKGAAFPRGFARTFC